MIQGMRTTINQTGKEILDLRLNLRDFTHSDVPRF